MRLIFSLFCSFIFFCCQAAEEFTMIEPVGHDAKIVTMSWSPDGNYLASASASGQVLVWEMKSGRLYARLSGHNRTIHSLAWHPSGKRLLSASADKSWRVWDIENEQCLQVYNGHKDEVLGASFSPDGKRILSWSKDFYIKILPADGTASEVSVKCHSSPVFDACWSFDGKQVFTAGGDKSAGVWSSETGKNLFMIKGHTDQVKKVLFTSEGIITASLDGTVKLWNSSDFSLKQKWVHPQKKSVTAIFSGSGKMLINWEDDSWMVSLNNPLPLKQLKGIFYANADFTALSNGKELINDLSPVPLQNPANGKMFFHPGMPVMASADALNNIRLTETKGGKDLFSFTGYTSPITATAVTEKHRYLVTASRNGEIRVFDRSHLSWEKKIPAHKGKILYLELDEEEKVLISVGADLSFKQWTFPSLQLIREGVFHQETVNAATRTRDDKFTFTASDDNSILISNTGNKKDQAHLIGQNSPVLSLRLSRDEKYLFSGGLDGKILMWDWKKNKEIPVDFKHAGEVSFLDVSEDGKYLFSYGSDRLLKVWDIGKKSLLKASSDIDQVIRHGRSFLCRHRSGRVFLLNPLNGKEEFSIQVKPGQEIVAYNETDNRMFTRSNATLHLYEGATGKWIASSLAFGNEEILLGQDQFYQATPGAARLLSWKKNGKLVPFDQLDGIKNRPDKICRQLNICDAELTDLYEKAIIKRNGSLDAKGAQLPDVEIEYLLSDKSLYQQKSTYELGFKISKQSASVVSWNVWINGWPLYGEKGIKGVPPENRKVKLPLIAGLNQVRMVLKLGDGQDSSGPLLAVYSDVKEEPSRLFFIGIGVSDYKDKTNNLRFAASDTKRLEAFFKTKEKDMVSIILLDNAVTRENVMAVKKRLQKECRPQDRVIISLSGHGLISASLDFYFATWDVDFAKPEKRGLAYTDIIHLADSIPAMKRLLLIDACHSGDLDKEGSEWKFSGAGTGITEGKRGAAETGDQVLITPEAFLVMQEMFNRLGRGNGCVVLSAASGNEYAYEASAWQGGVFTYCFITAFSDPASDLDGNGKVSLQEISAVVGEKVLLLTGGKQKPCARQVNYDMVWELY